MSDEVMTADGLEGAFVGIAQRFESDGHRRFCVYDYEKCVQILIDRDGMSAEKAMEYMEFNTIGAYVGRGTPAFVNIMTMDAAIEDMEDDPSS